MNTPLRLAAIFSLLVGSLFARLDESEGQLVHRYGRVRLRTTSDVAFMPGAPTGETLVFCVDGCTVKALVIAGHCQGIAYAKPGDWTEEELWHILENNGGYERWEESPSDAPDSAREWKRRDHAIAVWQKSQGIQLLSCTNCAPAARPRVSSAVIAASLSPALFGEAVAATE